MSDITMQAVYPTRPPAKHPARVCTVELDIDLIRVGGRRYLESQASILVGMLIEDMKQHAPQLRPGVEA